MGNKDTDTLLNLNDSAHRARLQPMETSRVRDSLGAKGYLRKYKGKGNLRRAVQEYMTIGYPARGPRSYAYHLQDRSHMWAASR